ncbi:MAG: hypothetical protein M1608_12210 [Candidatus Omnitrophica bacterium]|nr:hypothetical protein [Candidatus Omnitrophota bacterium]
MNIDSQLKLQAYLDGELKAGQTRQVAEWLDKDPEARALFAELQHTTTIMTGNEPPVKLPVPGEFFWARIEREITARPSPRPRYSWAQWWRVLLPLGAVGLLVALLLPRDAAPGKASSVATLKGMEVETYLPNSQVITFRSESEGVSFVWVDTR